MIDTWSLDELYKGYDDPAFIADRKQLTKLVNEMNALSATLQRDQEEEMLVTILKKEEALQEVITKLGSYISLRQATNTSDSETVALMEQLEQMVSGCTKALTICDVFISETKDLEQYILNNRYLQEYAYLLEETKKDGQYRLSDDVESVITKLNLSGGNAWGNLQEYLTSTLQVAYQGKNITLSEVRNMAYEQDPTIRKTAYEAELQAYENIKESIAFALNNIKSQVNTVCELRGFSSPLTMTLYHARMQPDTLHAMITSIKEYLPYFHKYIKRKAEILGHKQGLPWYDLFAPLSSTQTKFTIDQAKDYLVSHFAPFSQDLATMVEEAFDQRWIDFYPRNGKVGGAFCANLPFLKQSRILANFDGTIGDIVTLAHELGHAYHGKMIENHRPLNTNYSMPVAETASTFNENIIMNAAIDEEIHPQAKLALIESQLQDLTQIICDIYARFLFEKAVFEKRKSSFMFADELSEMMIAAQKEAYGDALDPATLHPYMWVNKSHYYSSSLSFYNFPYAFGGLFARGLIAIYKKEGAAFVPKYQKMLEATTISSVENVARMADIDITKEAFWRDSLETCVERIDEFIDLSQQ